MSSKYNFLAVERDGSPRNSGFAEEQGRVPDALSQEAGSDAAQDFSEEECELLFGDDVETDDHQGLLYDDSRAGEDFASYLHDPVESPVDMSLGTENHNFSQAKNNNGKMKFKMKAEKRTNEQNNTSGGFCEEKKSAKKSRLTTSGIRSMFAQLRLQLSFNRYANRKSADDNMTSLMPRKNEGKKRKKGDGGNLCKSFSSRTGIQSFSFADSKIGIADASANADLLIYHNMKNYSSENCDAITNTGNRFPDVGQNPEGCTSAVSPYSSIKSRRSAHGSNFTLVSRRWSSVPTFVETDKSVSAAVADSRLNRLCSTCKPHGFDGDRIDPDAGVVTIWSRISSAIQHGLQCRKLLMKRTTYNIPNAFAGH